MDSKELRGLMEAYSEVYSPQQIDEISAGLAGKVVNARIAATGAAADRENRARTPQNVRDTVAASDKEARARKLAAGVRKRRVAALKNEELDIFDVVLEFLQAEGFAETLEEAEWLMANMIDEEAIDIILGEASRADDTTRANIARYAGKKGISFEPGPNWDPSANRGRGAHLNPKQKEKQRRKALRQEEYMDEAQVANRDPEKYEREQSKKSAPVRGERTPMPPRGDKRREDFEKWYSANVR